MTTHALIIDDEPDIRELLEITLGRMGIETESAADVSSAKQRLSDRQYDLCLTDMKLPDGNGIELVRHIQKQAPQTPVAVITAHGNMDTAIESMKAGAFDFVSKPIELDRLRTLVSSALRLKDDRPVKPLEDSPLAGQAPAMEKLRKQIKKLSRSQAPVYISGESGSGKELTARSIHQQGPRASGPFIPVNCGAIPSELMESEFFGHSKGSFTGAHQDKTGLFQAADGGTLFLDEVADLPLDMQVKLLRAIQEKAIRPVGTQQEIPIDVRILSATHKNLKKEIEADNFRQDLYYRINVIEIQVPPLRQRPEDIPLLAEQFLYKLADEMECEAASLSKAALKALKDYNFPGNVRELENILERAYTLCEDNVIDVDDLQLGPVEAENEHSNGEYTDLHGESLDHHLEEVERDIIIKALEETRWNRTAAAKKLGVSFRSLRYRLKKLGLDSD